jgi:N-acetylmuramoyl-L-alanine amidase
MLLKHSNMWIAACAILVLVGIAHPSFALNRGADELFKKSCREFEELSKDPRVNRIRWLRLVNSFRKLEKTAVNSRIANESTCFAGRALLGLYHRGRRSEDLAKAIGFFKKYNRQAGSSGHLRRPARRTTSPVAGKTPVWPGEPQAPNPAISRPQGAASAYAKTLPDHPIRNNSFHWTGNPFVSRKRSPDDAPNSTGKQPGTRLEEKSKLVPTVSARSPDIRADSQRKASDKLISKGILVVFDPGHGGKDPGAVSRDGKLKEKDVTLNIAKRIKRLIEAQNPRIRIVMTRNDDTFLKLEERTALANSLDADLFVSIHCNASTEASPNGIETYFLSTASSQRAMEVAARENGVPLQKLNDIQTTLLDLMVTSKSSQSQELATTVHSALAASMGSGRRAAADRGVRRAPFYVLLGAKMPSILVECSFISNPRERRRLQDPAYLNLIAKGIAGGAQSYLQKLGQRSTGLASVSKSGSPSGKNPPNPHWR